MPSNQPRDLTGQELNLAELILLVKGNYRRGGMTYAKLAARRPLDEDGKPYGPDEDRLEQMARHPLDAYPHPKTMKGLAIMLRVTEQTVVDACSRSVGLQVNRRVSRLELRLPQGTELLSSAQEDAFLTLLNGQVEAARAALDHAEKEMASAPPRKRPAPKQPAARRPRAQT